MGGRKSEDRRQRSAVLGGQRCRHRKPLLLQATEAERERKREDGEKERERERSPRHFRGQPNKGVRAQEHYSGWWEEKLEQRDKKRGERL